jgi:hypothetical protein
MQHPAFREYMSYVPAMQFNDAEDDIYSEEESIYEWWNELFDYLDFFVATISLTAAIVAVSARTIKYPLFSISDRADGAYNGGGLMEPREYLYSSSIICTICINPSTCPNFPSLRLAICPEYCHKAYGKSTAPRYHQMLNPQSFSKVFKCSVCALDSPFSTGQCMP